MIDSLWLHSILDNRQASNARFEWSRRMINVAGRIIGLSRKVRKEAYNSGKKELVESVAGEEPTDEGMDPELKEAVESDEKEKKPKAKAKPKTEADTKEEKKEKVKAA